MPVQVQPPLNAAPSQPSRSTACTKCGYSWPWARFGAADQLRPEDAVQCIQCEDPRLDELRWKGELQLAREIIQVARTKLRQAARPPAPARQTSQLRETFHPNQTLDAGPNAMIGQPAVLPSQHRVQQGSAPVQPQPNRRVQQAVPQPDYRAQQAVPLPPHRIQQRGPPSHVASVPVQAPYPQHGYPGPNDRSNAIFYMEEPRRVQLWLTQNYVRNPAAKLEQMTIYNHYLSVFRPNPYLPHTSGVLSGVDFLTLIPRVFPGCRLNAVGYVVEGIERKHVHEQPPTLRKSEITSLLPTPPTSSVPVLSSARKQRQGNHASGEAADRPIDSPSSSNIDMTFPHGPGTPGSIARPAPVIIDLSQKSVPLDASWSAADRQYRQGTVGSEDEVQGVI